jgi:ribonuclease-3
MALKDWYRGLLRFIPKSLHERLNLTDHSMNYPQLNFFDKTQQRQIEKMVGCHINNIAHYEQALTHRSYLQVLRGMNVYAMSNERLEFLGDSVVGLIVSDYLFNFFPNINEGELTKMRAKLVNKHTLAYVAKNIDLQHFLRISFGTEKNFDKGGETIIADAFEALVAAIYVDSGIEKTIAFLYNHLIPLLDMEAIMSDTNYKSALLEIAQKNGKHPPTYEVIQAIGPDHDKHYTIGVLIDGLLVGTGQGNNKKNAEQAAAKNALENLHKDTNATE